MKEVTELEFVNFLEIVKEIPDYDKMTSYYLSGSRMSEDYVEEKVLMVGVIKDIREQTTKTGSVFCFVNIVNENELITLIFWNKEYLKWKSKLTLSEVKDKILIVDGRVKEWGGKLSVHVNQYSKLTIL